MNILITGDISSLALPIAKEFAKERNKVVLAGEDTEEFDVGKKNIVIHPINPARRLFKDAMMAYKFDVIIFIAVREEQLKESEEFDAGAQLDALRSVLELGKAGKAKRFFYISSTEVYGDMDDSSESVSPLPVSINGHTLLTGEGYCNYYRDEFGLDVNIIRIPYAYGPGENTGVLYKLIQESKKQDKVLIPGSSDKLWGFMHVTDLADFLKLAIGEEYSVTTPAINLSSGVPITSMELVGQLEKYFQNVTYGFDDELKLYTRSAPMSVAKNKFGWVDLHDIRVDFDTYQDLIEPGPRQKQVKLQFLTKRLSGFSGLLKWIELLLGAVLTQFLTQLTGTLIQYKYVDFRLLFVVVMGSVYGIQFGLLASLLVTISLFYTWYQLGIEWSLLFYNVGNWFPIALYFATGIIVGFNRDRNEALIDNKDKQIKLIYDKYEFLYEVFTEISKLKDEFRDQVIGFRDSFGKIFTITQELDSLQENAIYFRALTILENLMGNESIAIYSIGRDQTYARLESNSMLLRDKLKKSLQLSAFPEVLRSIEQGKIFQNSALLPDYPAYVAPVVSNSYPFNVPVGIIVIWTVKFEQYSTYYQNLFKVISGLIQASIVRATRFMDANHENIYLPATRVLTKESFSEVVKIRTEMKKNKQIDFQLIKLERPLMDVRKLDMKVSEGIRAADIVGVGPNNNYYILLSQADIVAANDVISRLKNLGLIGSVVDGI